MLFLVSHVDYNILLTNHFPKDNRACVEKTYLLQRIWFTCLSFQDILTISVNFLVALTLLLWNGSQLQQILTIMYCKYQLFTAREIILTAPIA